MDTIDSVLSTADRVWRGQGIGPADRAVLAGDLRLDLEAAAADGVGPDKLIGPDVTGFAHRLADESGVERTLPAYGRVIGTALVGAVLGAVAGVVLMMMLYPVAVQVFDIPRSIRVPVQVAVAVYYGIPSIMVAAGAALTVRLRLRDLPRIPETARAMTLLLPAAAAVVIPSTVGLGWLTGYSTSVLVVGTEVGLVLGGIAGATALARRYALRDLAAAVGAVRSPATAETA